MTTPTQILPVSLYACLGNLASDEVIVEYIVNDPHTFAAYMSVVSQVLLDNNLTRNNINLQDAKNEIESYMKRSRLSALSGLASDLIKDRESSLKILSELKRTLGSKVTAAYSGSFINFIQMYDLISSDKGELAAKKILKGILYNISVGLKSLTSDITTQLDVNVDYIAELLDLSIHEKNLILANILITVDSSSTIFFEALSHATNDRPEISERIALNMILGGDVDISPDEAKASALRALDPTKSKPLAFNICHYDSKTKRFYNMSDFWVKAISFYNDSNLDDKAGFFNQFIEEAIHKKSYSGALARIGDKEKALVTDLLAINKDGVDLPACNIIFYGSRKLDKREVVLTLLEETGYKNLYHLTSNLAEGDYPSACWIAKLWLAKRIDHPILIVNKAESVLSKARRRPSFFDFFAPPANGSKDDEELNSDEYLLNESKTTTVWITDSISALSDETIGRFFVHCEVKGGTRKDRRAEVERVVKELNLNADLGLKLAKYYELGSHQIRSAAGLVKVLNKEDPEASELILDAVERSQKALGRNKMEQIRDSVTKYDLGLLNLNTRYRPEQIIEALKKSEQGTLCFYGLPGTGKTQLAEYIATQLDKPLITKPASELLSKWLGESEKNIAEAFQEARDEDAVLLIDEADSFLRDRTLAQHSWEVTQVNELLQRMEMHNGVFIMATNLFAQIDAAAMRRFTFKIEFLELTEKQRVAMFENESGVKIEPDTQLWVDLLALRRLTPGDFAAVRKQERILSIKYTPDEWIEQLEVEAKAKTAGLDNLQALHRVPSINMKDPK